VPFSFSLLPALAFRLAMGSMGVYVDVEAAAAGFVNLVMDVEWERSWDESAASADDGLVAVLFVLV
jgi:hypothetical protein